MDIRQSGMYVEYMRRIGWVVDDVEGVKVFVKRFPLVGSVIKIQRPEKILSMQVIDELAKKYRAWSVSVEQKYEVRSMKYEANGFKVNNNPYLPTKTIQINLMAGEDDLFQRFTGAKRRAVRRAIKNNVIVKETDNVEEFIKLKSKDFWPLSFFMAKDIRALWESFRPRNATVILGSEATPESKKILKRVQDDKRDSGQARMTPVAGVLLLFYDNIAYYWMATSTNEGKKLFAPTLLVWEALKLAKKKECAFFDFEGIYDERFAKATNTWKGFTKFKEGFGGKILTYPDPLIKRYFYRAF